jgi:transcriptional antiterminator RfaH
MRWYLIHTKPRQEAVALQNLERQGYVCYMPLFACEKIRRGALKVETEPLFSRYLFIQLDTSLTSQSWSPIRSTKGVSRLVSFGGQPARVSDAIIAILRSVESNTQDSTQRAIQRIFNPGDHVQLTEGAFAGFEGIYQAADGAARAMVLIELLSKQVQIGVAPAGLRKVA